MHNEELCFKVLVDVYTGCVHYYLYSICKLTLIRTCYHCLYICLLFGLYCRCLNTSTPQISSKTSRNLCTKYYNAWY